MPINLMSVNTGNIAIKDAFDKLARNAMKLENPSQTGQLYVATAPTEMDEGSFLFYYDGTNYRIYTKINNVIKYIALT